MWREPTEWEKIFKNHASNNGLASRMCKELTLKTWWQKIILKWANDLNGPFSKKRYTNDQKVHEKMVNIISNANECQIQM